MNPSELFKPITDQLNQVDSDLLRLLQSGDTFVSQSVARIIHAGGKRLRPALLLTSAKMCDYSGNRSVRLAAVVELIHTATLIHDDVVDNDSLRRGIPTMNSQWGGAVSIVTGDYLYSRAFEILAEYGDIEIMRCVASTTSRIAHGDLVQALARDDSSLTEEKYLSIISDKTASLFSCSCRLGAMLGRRINGEVEILSRYGYNLGMAFQITDDILDLTQEDESLGKSVGSDIREGNLTLPLIHTLRVADGKDKEWIISMLKSKAIDRNTVKRLRTMAQQYNGIEYSRKKAQAYAGACKKEISALGKSEVTDMLALFADNMKPDR